MGRVTAEATGVSAQAQHPVHLRHGTDHTGVVAALFCLPRRTLQASDALEQQGIAPHSSTSLGGIKKTGDISKRLRLVHAVQNRRQIFANGPVLGLRLKTETGCGGIVEGGFHPQAVIWVIRLTSPHLP